MYTFAAKKLGWTDSPDTMFGFEDSLKNDEEIRKKSERLRNAKLA